MVLQGHYLGPPSTVPLGHGLEVFEEPCTIKPLEIGSFFSTPPPSGFTASSTVSRAPNRNTEPPGVILGRFEYLRALKGIHADSDDFSGFSDSDGDGDEKAKEARRLEGVRRRNVDRFFRVYVYKDSKKPTDDEQMTARAFMSVGSDTAAQYASSLRGIVKADFKLTLDGYNSFMATPNLPLAASTLNQYLVALHQGIRTRWSF